MIPRVRLDDQIVELMDETLTEPVRRLLGEDLAGLVAARVESRAQLYAAQLVDADRRLAAQTAIDLACLLPDPVPAEFWATPLGQAIARTCDPPQVVSAIDAARILGVTRARVYQLIDTGHIRAEPGGVGLDSVLNRLADA